MKRFRKILALLISAALLLSCVSMSAAAVCDGGEDCPSGKFTDVDPAKWYHEYVDFAVERGLMSGMTSTTFEPNTSLTRGMLVTILYSYAGAPAVTAANPFVDVAEGRYYAEAVKWAAANGIVAGMTSTTFAPNTDITREQIVMILYGYAKYKGADVSAQESLAGFDDAGEVSNYAKTAMAWAVAEGIVVGDNGNLRPQDDVTRAEAAAMLKAYIEGIIEGAPAEPAQPAGSAASSGSSSSGGSVTVPTLSVESTIFGQGDTGGKTTLKNILLTAEGPGDQTIRYSDPETGERLDYPVYNEDGTLFQVEQPPVAYTGSAVLTLGGGNVIDSRIDSKNAKVELVDGDGYYADELVLSEKASKLEGTWKNGQMEYSLDVGDLEWYTGDYKYIDNNSGREWSILGGDGNGCYTFNFQVSGIRYAGRTVEPATFQVKVYIWGRTGTDLAPTITDLVAAESETGSGKTQSNEIQWTWVGDTSGNFLGADPIPVLCDDKQDDFFITWPAGIDASGLTAKDVTVTLYTQYGESYVLKSSGEHVQYAVFSGEGETQVAVTFRHAAFVPVFNTMTIEVNGGGDLTASKTYDIASVYTYMVQQGGGGITVDGTVTAYSYYGYEGLSVDNAVPATYTLKYTDLNNGKTWYYNEDGGLSEAVPKTTIGFMGPITTLSAPDDAVVFDAMGEGDCDVQFIVNTLFVKTRLDQTEVKTVGGEDVVFSKEYSSGQIGNWDGVSLAPGYVRTDGFSPNQQWAWSRYYGSGWSPELNIIPTDFPYEEGPFGGYADQYAPSSGGPGGPGGPGSSGGPGESGSSAPVTYTSGGTALTLNSADSTFTMIYGDNEKVEGTYTSQSKFNFFTKQISTIIILDEASSKKLAEAGVFPAWYVYLTPNQETKTFTITKDVSYALIPGDADVYGVDTVENGESATGYTTAITVKDNGYENVYAYGDWVSVDAEGNKHEPEAWRNGDEYATSSVRKLEKNTDGHWEIKLDLASSVMGVIAYRDVQEEDLVNLFPQKLSFYVPYDTEKQSESTDWTPAFPASETGVAAGRIYDTTCTVGGETLSVSVYTPAGYDAKAEGGYPVAYLIPGGGSTYQSWFTDGMVGNIFDNLIDAGKVQPTIVVSMQREDVNAGKLDDIIAWVEANYNVAEGAENRALGGVSMGSVAATQLWQADPTRFDYYAFLSGGDPAIRGAYQDAGNYTYVDPTAEILEGMKDAAYFLGGGTTDFNMFVSNPDSASITDLDAWMTHYGIAHNAEGNGRYDVTVGDHNWPIWMKLMPVFVSDYLWK